MEVDDGLRVQKVLPGSAALRAGVEVGDELTAMNGQPLVSQADIQWVLHRAPAETTIAVKLRRDGKILEKSISVSGNWRDSDLSWRETSWGFRPGLWTIPLSGEERKKRKIPPEDPALLVKWAFGNPPLSKQAGIRDGDVIVAVDGQPVPPDESHFMALVRLNHPPGDKVKLTLLRSGKKEDVLMQVE
jgi:S1-C subfamily serine protease